jgi:hypothetical protein
VPEQKLDSTQVACLAVDFGHLCRRMEWVP